MLDDLHGKIEKRSLRVVSNMEKDFPTMLAELQAQLLVIRDIALVAPPEQKEALLTTARLVEQCIRAFDKDED